MKSTWCRAALDVLTLPPNGSNSWSFEGLMRYDNVWSFLDDAWWRKRCEKVWEGVKTECEYMFLLGSPACILRLRLRTTRKANLPKDQNSKDVAQAQPLGLYAAWILTPTKCTQSFTCRTSAWTPANWLFLDSRPVHCSCVLSLLGALAFFFVPASKKVVPRCCAIYSYIDSKSGFAGTPKKETHGSHSSEAFGLLFLSVILDPLQGLTSYQPQPTLEPKEWWNIKHDRPLLLDKRERRRKDSNLASLASTSTNAIEYNQMHMFKMLKCTVDIQRNITNMYAN